MFGKGLKFPTHREHALDGLAADMANSIEADPIDQRAAQALFWSIREAALVAVLMTMDAIAEDNLDELTPSEYLDAAMLDAMGVDSDEGEQTDPVLLGLLSEDAQDAFMSLGISEEMVMDIFGTDVAQADKTLQTAADIAIERLPSDGEPMDRFVKDFVYGNDEENGDTDSEFDSMGGGKSKPLTAGKKTTKKLNGHTLVYKAVKAIRNGVQTVVNKRVSGTVKQSSKQRAALNKARMKSHTGAAIKRQMRSLGKGIAKGLYKAHGLMSASTARYRKAAHS